MQYYTSYCARAKDIPSDYLQVSIMRFKPDWYKPDLELKGLAPKADDLLLFKEGKISILEFSKRYNVKVLNTFSIANMDKYFRENYPNYTAVVFMCMEKSESFCHRHLLAQHIMVNSDLDCIELKF